MNERDVLLNELVQGLRPMSEGIEWFDGLGQEERPRLYVPGSPLHPGARSPRRRTGEHPRCRVAPDAYARSVDLTRPDRQAAGKDCRSRASRRTPQGVQAADRGAHDCRRATPRALLLWRLQSLVAQTAT